jgi:hypothetical protein
MDLSGVPVVWPLPFVVDTGTDATIVPRKLLPDGLFPRSKAVSGTWIPVVGLAGGWIAGLPFAASLAISPQAPGANGLSFGRLTVVVVDSWDQNYGMLGMDALRNVVTVFDRDHVCFWPVPTGAGK